MPSPAVEDYLKAIYKLSGDEKSATTSAVAERLGVAAGSVTGMLKRLSEQALVEHVPYYGARLTPAGEAEAVRMIRRHRVLELFLVDVLGYTWDRVHEEAERLEHAASDELVDRMAAVLGEPEVDPHGAPIPCAGEAFEDRRYKPLTDVDVGATAVLRRVSDRDPDALRYLARLDLRPGVELEVIERQPFDGPVTVRIGTATQTLGHALSATLRVEPVGESASGTAGTSSTGERDE